MNVFKWDALSRKDYYVDYQNKYTFAGVVPQRRLFTSVAGKLLDAGRIEDAEKVLDKCLASIPKEVIPYDITYLNLNNERDMCMLIDAYRRAGLNEKGSELCQECILDMMQSVEFYAMNADICYDNLKDACELVSYQIGILSDLAGEELATQYEDALYDLINTYIATE